jgi:hypothetical protein
MLRHLRGRFRHKIDADLQHVRHHSLIHCEGSMHHTVGAYQLSAMGDLRN